MFGPAVSPTPLRTFGTDDALAFVEGRGVDAAGRTIEDYFKFDADKWEECHNHVQWAFPSHIMSRFNMEAPVVDMEDFSNRLSAQGHVNIKQLMGNYLTSLGWFEDKGGWHADLKHERAELWLTPYNHNYQRISRLLNLLSWIDSNLAIELLNEFLTVAQEASKWVMEDHFKLPMAVINAETVVYWSKAAIGKL